MGLKVKIVWHLHLKDKNAQQQKISIRQTPAAKDLYDEKRDVDANATYDWNSTDRILMPYGSNKCHVGVA